MSHPDPDALYLAKAALGIDQVKFSFEQLAQKLGSGILSRLIQDQITGPLSKALVALARTGLEGVFSGLFGGGGYGISAARGSPVSSAGTGLGTRVGGGLHEGGIAGREASFGRLLPAALFASAPRFHSGGMIGPGEVPAILRQGEGVFTEGQMKALAPARGGSVTVVVNDYRTNGGEPVQVNERQDGDGRRVVEVTILDTVARGIASGQLDRAARQAWGVTRRGA